MTMDGAASPLPMVRIVVLTFDGGDLTMACLRSLCDLDWLRDRFEIVLVANGWLDEQRLGYGIALTLGQRMETDNVPMDVDAFFLCAQTSAHN